MNREQRRKLLKMKCPDSEEFAKLSEEQKLKIIKKILLKTEK